MVPPSSSTCLASAFGSYLYHELGSASGSVVFAVPVWLLGPCTLGSPLFTAPVLLAEPSSPSLEAFSLTRLGVLKSTQTLIFQTELQSHGASCSSPTPARASEIGLFQKARKLLWYPNHCQVPIQARLSSFPALSLQGLICLVSTV